MSTLVKTLCLSLVLMSIFFTVCYLPFSPSIVTMSSSRPIGVRRVNRLEPEKLTKGPKTQALIQVPWEWANGTRAVWAKLLLEQTSHHTRHGRDMPPPVPKRVDNPRIRDNQALLEFFELGQDTPHYLWRRLHTSMVWKKSIYLPTIFEKTGTNVELYKVSTCQCSFLYNNKVSFHWKSEFRKPQNLKKPIARNEEFNVADVSLLRELSGNNYAHVILTAKAGVSRQTRNSCLRSTAWWDVTQAEVIICQFM